MGRFVDKSNPPDYRTISYGGGVQSTAMIALSVMGEITPAADCAIFADTGWEPAPVYETVQWMTEWAAERGFTIHTVSIGNIRDDILGAERFASIPFFTKHPDKTREGRLRRQCTREYKIDPICRKIREILGYKKYAKTKHLVETWLGISTDEVFRIKQSRLPWQINRHPLIELNMSRQDCIDWLADNGFPPVMKSSCIGCPYHNNAFWRRMKTEWPADWEDVCEFDEWIRDFDKRRRGGVESKLYIHRSCTPLRTLDLTEDNVDLEGEECSGYCFV